MPNLILGGADQQAMFRLLYGVDVLKGTANVALGFDRPLALGGSGEFLSCSGAPCRVDIRQTQALV